jgi:hypothetical protein
MVINSIVIDDLLFTQHREKKGWLRVLLLAAGEQC